MPALQRRQPSADLRRTKMSRAGAHLMVKSHSRSSSEDATDFTPPKVLTIPENQVGRLPERYESDEESVSPCPDEFDTASGFSDEENKSPFFFESNECPSIVEAKRMDIVVHSRPVMVNISKLAPLEKRRTPSHVRPALQPPAGEVAMKTSIGRTIVVQSTNGTDTFFRPTIVALQRPPMRFRPPPPVPPRNEARVAAPAVPMTPKAPSYPPPAIPAEQEAIPPNSTSHAPRPSVSTVGSLFEDDSDDDDSSVGGDSLVSSAASSVADSFDLAGRSFEAGSLVGDTRKNSHALREQQDAELRRAINDYMLWRSEGSPGEPPETVFKLTSEDRQMVRDHEEEEWKRELERGLTTPTPTSYAAYDPFGMRPPSLVRPKASFQLDAGRDGQQPLGRMRGLRNMVRRAI